jgi:O-antigen/teichoic acid export membrane protein
MLGIDFWLIPHHGAFGAAIGWAAAIVVKNVAGLAQVWRDSGLHPFAIPLFTMAALDLVCFVAVPAAVYLLPLSRAVAFFLGLVLGSAAACAGLWTLRRPLRLDEFRALRRRRPARDDDAVAQRPD